jgi:sialate O-acetylesterase
MARSARVIAVLLGCLASNSPLRAEVHVPALFSDHAVLQKSPHTAVWGTADAGERITVSLGPAKAESEAGADGRWKAFLDLEKVGPGPFELVIQGKNRLVIADVVVGEVWLASGQSNMQWILKGDSQAGLELKRNDLLLRQFQVAIDTAPEPKEDCVGSWTVASPQNVGAFSAVAYYFGRSLREKLNVPVGLIHSSVPGSPIEVWMSQGAFEKVPELDKGRIARVKKYHEYPERLKEYVSAYSAWEEKFQRADKPLGPDQFAAPGVVTQDWVGARLPGKMMDSGLPASGAIWLRRSIPVPASSAGKAGTVTMGTAHDFIKLYWNGTKFAETSPAAPPPFGIYKFSIPGELIKEGENTLAIRLFSASDTAGIDAGNSSYLSASFYGMAQAIRLEGPWPSKVESVLAPLSKEAAKELPRAPSIPSPATPTFNFNAMIAPLIPYGIRGIIWYQGEANVNRPVDYRAELPAFITDLREKWGRELPFYFCQLPNYLPRDGEPGKGGWADFREAQSSGLSLPQTGQAVLIDVGEEGNLHPRNKKDPGERLARLALARDYGQDVPTSGPVYETMTAEGGALKLSFKHSEGGLIARPLPSEYKPISQQPLIKPLVRKSPGSQLEGFVICGADRKWVPADARIDGERVVVSSPEVAAPVAARYGWEDCPFGNLANASGLPAGPFRTDDFPLPVQPMKF